jgi:hypothetical protein
MIRPRRSEDLEPCLRLLHAVHQRDRYPFRWPEDPPRWLTGRFSLGASRLLDDGHSVLPVLLFVLPDSLE